MLSYSKLVKYAKEPTAQQVLAKQRAANKAIQDQYRWQQTTKTLQDPSNWKDNGVGGKTSTVGNLTVGVGPQPNKTKQRIQSTMRDTASVPGKQLEKQIPYNTDVSMDIGAAPARSVSDGATEQINDTAYRKLHNAQLAAVPAAKQPAFVPGNLTPAQQDQMDILGDPAFTGIVNSAADQQALAAQNSRQEQARAAQWIKNNPPKRAPQNKYLFGVPDIYGTVKNVATKGADIFKKLRDRLPTGATLNNFR